MPKLEQILVIILFFVVGMEAYSREYKIVVDSVSRTSLSNASVFDNRGNLIGMTDSKGRLPYAVSANYPITIRYMGFMEKSVSDENQDTIYMQENIMELPEVVIESRQQKVLHILAYVREYSTLTTYSDTVFLFREKMVDYMLPTDSKVKYDGWRSPRVLKSKSYYRFTNAHGLDSVSDHCSHHFSWTDWVGLNSDVNMPESLIGVEVGTDTIYGKYSPTEVWNKNQDRLILDVNVLADTASRKWVPNLSLFFQDQLDFEQFRVKFSYENVVGNKILPVDLTGYSFNIESNGRGRGMFRFSRKNEPFFVSTYAEVYIVDKEYITLKEAKKWDAKRLNMEDIAIIEPQGATELQPAIMQLIDRVNNIDYAQVRSKLIPDKRLASRKVERNAGQKVLQRIKGILGISKILGKRKQDKQWREFRQEQLRNNQGQMTESD